MEKKEQLYEGKAKKVYATDEEGYVIVSYKDDATALDGQKRGTIVGKGAINNRMTNYSHAASFRKGGSDPFCEGTFRARNGGAEGVRSFRWRSLSGTFPPGPLPNAMVWKRGSCSRNPPLNSPIKTTNCTTR